MMICEQKLLCTSREKITLYFSHIIMSYLEVFFYQPWLRYDTVFMPSVTASTLERQLTCTAFRVKQMESVSTAPDR